MPSFDLDTLKDQELSYFGMDNQTFKLGKMVFTAIEDDNDGYRSCLKEVEQVTDKDLINTFNFFRKALAKVKVVKSDGHLYFDGHLIVEVKDGHVWAKIGTDDSEDYYPCFVCTHYPKVP